MIESLSEFGNIVPAKGLAYGVDDKRPQLYSLRQARYQAIASDIQRLAPASEKSRPIKILDIGAKTGVSKKYLDAWPIAKRIAFYGADIEAMPVYERQAWSEFWIGDLMQGYPEIPSDTFDFVICEQVLEHLNVLETAVRTLERVLRPGGILFVGVPIFPHGVHLLRRHVVPMIDKFSPFAPKRSHVQAFSRRTFTKLLSKESTLDIIATRGFRIVSGGVLRPLENHRFWWRFNRWLGARVPGLCVEIQVVARKPERLPANELGERDGAPAGVVPSRRLTQSPQPSQ